MKHSNTRRFRRRPAAREAASLKKDNQQEQQFFGETMHDPFFKPVTASPQPAAIQRKCDDCDKDDKKVKQAPDKKQEDKKLMKKEDKKEEEKKVMKKESDKEDEEQLQMKKADSSPSTTLAASYINSMNGKGSPLSKSAQQFFGKRMGYNFSHVKVHTDMEAADSAKAVNAKAYTVGNHVVFNEGQFNHESDEGKKLMAHELAHVMQQDAGNKLNRKANDENLPEAKITIPTFFSREMVYQNTRHYANCDEVSVEGFTDANYNNSYSSPGSSTPGSTCDGCAPGACVSNSGTVISVFTPNPQVSLPSVPSGLNECEQAAVLNFINTTLNAHEQEHVAAFNSYAGTVNTPYSYVGCASGVEEHTRQIHERIETARKASADAASAALDVGGANIFSVTCDCPDPAPTPTPDTSTE